MTPREDCVGSTTTWGDGTDVYNKGMGCFIPLVMWRQSASTRFCTAAKSLSVRELVGEGWVEVVRARSCAYRDLEGVRVGHWLLGVSKTPGGREEGDLGPMGRGAASPRTRNPAWSPLLRISRVRTMYVWQLVR